MAWIAAMIWEIALIFFLLVANGVFAMAELAIVSSRKARLSRRAEEGDAGAKAALSLIEAPNEFLSTVQVGITLVGVFAGAFGGATLSERVGVWLNEFSWIAPHGPAVAFLLVVSIITYFSLVIGELVPKRLAMNNPERIAAAVAGPMRWLSRVAAPVVRFLSWSTECSMSFLGLGGNAEPPVSEDEVKGLLDQGLRAGVFHQTERDMVEGVFRLDRQLVGELMTPSTRIVWLNADESAEANWRRIVASGHSQFPVFRGNRETVLGVVSVKALWANTAVAGVAIDLGTVMSQPLIVPESSPAIKVLETFRKTGKHFALVADEFGSIRGLVTLHDIMEAIVGQLPEQGQRFLPTARRRDDGSWLIDAALEIPDVKRVLRLRRLPGDAKGEFVSLGGFIIDQLGRLPREGEKVVSSGYVFEVVDMDHQRIDKILVTRLEAQKKSGA